LGVKHGHWNLASDGYGFAQRLDTLDLVHGLSRKIRFSAVWTGPHRDAFYYQKCGTASKAARDFAALKAFATAGGAFIT